MCRKTILKGKKGFTLIEIIVVLVILAVMAAVGIPSMIGFVEDARGKANVAEARVGFVAAQAVVTEFVTSGDGSTNPTSDEILANNTFINMTKDVDPGKNKFSGIIVDASTHQVTYIEYDSHPGTGNASKGYKVTINTDPNNEIGGEKIPVGTNVEKKKSGGSE